MITTVVAANAATVTLTVTCIPHDTTDEAIVAKAKHAAAPYGIAESGHRVSRAVQSARNPVEAVVTLDRQERA